VECGLWQYKNKVEITKGIHSLNLLGENNPKGVLKTIPKRPFVDKWGMHWNVNLKESEKSSRFWSHL
jgi:hypothetical protein